MKTLPIAAAAAALLALAACTEPPAAPVDNNAEPAELDRRVTPPAEMPPPIKSTKSYRCDDDSVVTVNLFVGDTQATIMPTPTSTPVLVKAEAAGQPMIAEGYSLAAKGSGITLAMPGKPSQSCNP